MECSYEGGTVPTIERTVKSTELVMKQPFQIIKAANNGETDADLLKGAGFSAYLKSSLEKKEDGSYDFSHAEPVILTADGKTEMFTDEKGYACSIPLPYGTYIVRETTTPHNYKPVEDFEITIRENNPDKPQVWKVLLDKEFSAKLKIIKKDDETKKPVLVAGTEFKIYDLDHKKYVEQVTTYPTVTVHKSFFTDSQGYLILPKNLEIGHYRIEEVTAPDGYVVNKNYVEITVDSDTAYEVDGVSGDVIIEVSYEDQPVKGNLIVYKKGEMLSGFENDFIYKEQYLSGAEFEVRAAEDICTPDHQKDADGNRIVLYAKDTLVTTITTGEGGKAVAKDLPLGRYYVVETKAPEGFVLNPEPVKVALTYQDQDTPIVEAEAIVGNDRQKVSISVEKQDAENGRVLSGAVFGIYNKKNIQANGKVLVKADTLLQEMTSDENGMATCTLDLPFGEYYVKELKAPEGFVSSDEVLEFVAEYQGQETKIVSLQAVKKNEPTTAEFTKSDLTTGVMTVLTNRLNTETGSMLKREGGTITQAEKERFGQSKMIRYVSGIDQMIYPIAFIKNKIPMAKRSIVCSYTKEGRALIHTELNLNQYVLKGLREKISVGHSTEYHDSKISLFSAQKGKCAISGEEFADAEHVAVWLKVPGSLGGFERYKNMVLIHKKYLILLQELPQAAIKDLIKTLNITKKMLVKINSLREQANLSAII